MARKHSWWLIFIPALLAIMSGCGGSSSAHPFAAIRGNWSKLNTPAAAGSINFFSVNSSNHWFIADRVAGFYRSTDQGATWTQINAGIPFPFGWTIQMDPANGDLIANTCSCNGMNLNPVAFFKSSDEGNTWTQIPDPSGFHLSLAGAQTGCAFAANSNIICGGYYGQGIAWISPNRGQSTATVAANPVLGTAFSFLANPTTHDLWLGTEQRGLYRSTDNGLSWAQVSPNATSFDPVNGINIGNVYGITYDNSGNVLASAGGGIWKSTASGAGYSWSRILANQNTSSGKGIGRDGNGNLYFGHNRDTLNPITLYRSTDGGATWAEFDSGIRQQSLQGRGFTFNPADGQMYVVIVDEPTNQGWLYRTGG